MFICYFVITSIAVRITYIVKKIFKNSAVGCLVWLSCKVKSPPIEIWKKNINYSFFTVFST